MNQIRLLAFGALTILAIHIGVSVSYGDGWYEKAGVGGMIFSTVLYIIPSWSTLILAVFLLYKQEQKSKANFWSMVFVFHLGWLFFALFQGSMLFEADILRNLHVTILGGPTIIATYCFARYLYELFGDVCDEMTGDSTGRKWDVLDIIIGVIIGVTLSAIFATMNGWGAITKKRAWKNCRPHRGGFRYTQ